MSLIISFKKIINKINVKIVNKILIKYDKKLMLLITQKLRKFLIVIYVNLTVKSTDFNTLSFWFLTT